jgi:hypothetical protein
MHRDDSGGNAMKSTVKNYYPTPDKLFRKMWSKVDHKRVRYILEPSAGQGAIAETIASMNRDFVVSCIEIDTDFQAILRSKKGLSVIDSDFLAYSGTDRFDLIIANPPFDDGASHLMKAIDLMYSGQIVFLLNAETLRNPFSNERKLLVRRLEELGADIEYVKDAFLQAERRTDVEVAIVYIDIKRDIDDALFDGISEARPVQAEVETESAVVSGNKIDGMVEMYNDAIRSGIDTIKSFYRNRYKFGEFLRLGVGKYADKSDIYCTEPEDTLTAVNDKINYFVSHVREKYWDKAVEELEAIKSRMTEKKREEFRLKMSSYSSMDFTAANIRQLILNLVGSYDATLTEATAEIFDRMSSKYHWSDETSQNVHYFNGWKTNKAWYVNDRVVLRPTSSIYGPFRGFNGWAIDYGTRSWLDDIDRVMNYFDESNSYTSISDALTKAFSEKDELGATYKSGKKIESTYFEIRVFLKGTIHLKFKSEDIRRRFNVTACKYKNWLFNDYGQKKYYNMTIDEKFIVEEFEGKDAYQKSMNMIGFADKPVPAGFIA